jgi:hypothetical protein
MIEQGQLNFLNYYSIVGQLKFKILQNIYVQVLKLPRFVNLDSFVVISLTNPELNMIRNDVLP